MKRTVVTVFTSIAAIVCLGACEQHSWDKTQSLHQPHGGEHHAEGDGHGTTDGHGEKEAAH